MMRGHDTDSVEQLENYHHMPIYIYTSLCVGRPAYNCFTLLSRFVTGQFSIMHISTYIYTYYSTEPAKTSKSLYPHDDEKKT